MVAKVAAVVLFFLLMGLLLALGAAPVRAQSRSVAVVMLRGDDTLVVTRVQRSASAVTSTIIPRGAPRMVVVQTLAPTHLVPEATFRAWGPGQPDDAEPVQSGTVRFVGDSVIVDIRGGGRAVTQRIGTKPDALLIVNNDIVVVEQLVRLARARGVTTLVHPVWVLTGGVTLDATLELIGRDSARFTVAGTVNALSIDAQGNVTGGRIAAQNLRMMVVEGAAAAKISLGAPNYAAPADAPYTAEDVGVRAPAGHTLSGTFTKPKGATGRVPAVITITGSGQQDRDEAIAIVPGYRLFREVADTLGRRGVAVLRLDDRGVGGSGGDVNGTSADFADDIRAGIAYLRTRDDVDATRIALVGHSEGGLIAPMIAATDARLAGLVLLAGPAYKGRDILDYQTREALRAATLTSAQRDSAARAYPAQLDSAIAANAWLRFFANHDPLPTMAKVKQPVLIVHGATDRQVRPEEARMLDSTLKAAGNTHVTTHVLPDLNHLFLHDPDGQPEAYSRLPSGKVDRAALGIIADWLVVTLRVH